MTRTHFIREVLLLLIAAVMVLSSAFAVCALPATEFSLSDAQVNENGLFEVVLSCKADYKLSAFVAELLYDPESISFDSASVLNETSQCSVNNLEKGKLITVYFDEEGTVCTDGVVLMSFKFKALTVGTTQIKLSVRDAITPESADITLWECVDSQVTVVSKTLVGKSSGKNTLPENSATNAFEADEESNSLIKGTTYISGVPVSNQTLVSAVLSFLCVMCIAVYIAYKTGAHRQKEKQKPAPLVYKGKAGKDELSD